MNGTFLRPSMDVGVISDLRKCKTFHRSASQVRMRDPYKYFLGLHPLSYGVK